MTAHAVSHASLANASRTAQAAGVAAALTAILLIAWALVPALPGDAVAPLGLDPGSPMALGNVLTAAGGAAMLLVARGLWRGTRRAADLTAVASVAAATLAVIADRPAAVAIALACAASLMLVGRRRFPKGTARTGTVLPASIAAASGVAAYAVAAGTLLAADRVGGLAAPLRIASWLVSGGWWLSSGEPTAIALDVLMVIALVSGGRLLHAIMRPEVARSGHTADDHARAAAIVAEHARDSLDPFALREDKSFFFTEGGLIAYRTLGATAIVAGDPVGPPGAAATILAGFNAYAAQRGWTVVMTGASTRFLEDYRRLGFQTLRIGEEALVDPQTFTLEGRAIRKVRQSVTRLSRLGWSIDLARGGQLSAATMQQAGRLESDWRAEQARLHGFAMTLGRLWGADEDVRSLYVLAREPGGELRAFLRFAEYERGLSLDVMRRAPGTPNGLNEAMVVAALVHARDQRLAAVSLNFAGFAHVMGTEPLPTWRQRVARWLLNRAHGRFQLERLVHFNDKFGPRWEPRHLVYTGRVSLPAAALRVLQAEAYVRPPRRRALTGRWRPRHDVPAPATATQALQGP